MKNALIVLFFLGWTAMSVFPAPVEVVILFTNDAGGHPLKFYYNQGEDQGGLPARGTLIKKLAGDRKKNYVLVVDAGGYLRGRPESNLYNGLTDIAGMNACGYDVTGIGLSEIWDSRKLFDKRNKKSEFYIVGSNLRTLNFNKEQVEVADSYYVKSFGMINPVKIGVFSVMSDELGEYLSEQAKKDFVLTEPVNAAKEAVEILKTKQKADIIIGLTQMGLYPGDKRISVKTLAQSLQNVDLIIDGRTGTLLTEPVVVGSTRIVQAMRWGLYVGEIRLKIENKKLIDFKYQVHPVNYKENNTLVGEKLEEDPAVLKAIQSVMKNFDLLLNKKIVKISKGKLNSEGIRTQETELGNLICDALIDLTGADCAFQNSGGISKGEININSFNRKSLDQLIQYENSVVIVNMTGDEIFRTLEYSLKRSGYGGFLQIGGIELTWTRGQSVLSHVKVKGKSINPEQIYKVAINSWLADGNDGHKIFKTLDSKNDLGILVREAVYQFLEKKGTYTPAVDGRINILD